MSMKKLFLFLLFNFIANNSTLEAMNLLKQKISQMNLKKIAITSLAAGLTCMHYGIAYHPLVGANCLLEEEYIDESKRLTPVVENFVKQELVKCGYTTFDKLKIVKDNQFGTNSTFSYDYLFFDGMREKRLEIILNRTKWDFFKDSSNSKALSFYDEIPEQEYKNLMASITQHEGTHLINKDSKRYVIAELAIICTIEAISFFLRRRLRPINFWVKQGSKIPTGFIKFTINIGAFMAFRRYSEQQADDGINDDIPLLEAQKKNMERHMHVPPHDSLHDYSFFWRYPKLLSWYDYLFFQKPIDPTILRWCNYIFFEDHPSLGDRFERFTERLYRITAENEKNKRK